MFGFVNVGERAGSGVDKIMTAWEEQNWEKPVYDISLKAERVILKLEVGQVRYIPGVADLRREEKVEISETVPIKNEKERKIIEYIKLNGSITTKTVVEICGYITKSGARKLLEKMIQKGMIQKNGDGSATEYQKWELK